MKVLITSVFVICISSFGFTQIKNESKIIESRGQAWYAQMQTEAPDLLNLFDKYLSYGFNIRNVSEGKYAEFEPMEFVPLNTKNGGVVTVAEFLADVESSDFNPLDYNFFPTMEAQVYKLKGVNKIIYILPQDVILAK
jgi:hypothetical protein